MGCPNDIDPMVPGQPVERKGRLKVGQGFGETGDITVYVLLRNFGNDKWVASAACGNGYPAVLDGGLTVWVQLCIVPHRA